MPISRALIQHTIRQAAPSERAKWYETHISWILLLGEEAYKIKKPVNLDFLDMRCQEERRALCYAETQLNRRLAPEIYLGVVPVFLTAGVLTFGQGEKMMDYAVHMRRLDPIMHAPNMLGKTSLCADRWQKTGYQLADFQSSAKVSQPRPPYKPPHEMWTWSALRPQIQAQLGSSICQLTDSLPQWMDREWTRLAGEVHSRGQSGMIRDGHGDLHLGNIFLYEQPIFFDCLEFDTRLRQIDVGDELAFLIMDLEAHQAWEEAEQVRIGYGLHPASRMPSERLFRYYKMYRAGIRAKVQLLTSRHSDEPGQQEASLEQVMRYLNLMDLYRRTSVKQLHPA